MQIFVRLLLLVVVALVTVGCTLASITVPDEQVDISAAIQRTVTRAHDTDLTEKLDGYIADHRERLAAAGRTLASIPLPREAVDIVAKIERTVTGAQVADLTENLDDYIADYLERFAVAPRRSDNPLQVAESYLRDYRPGPLPRVFQTTVICDRNGVHLAEIFDEGKRTWVSLDQISPYLIDAVIATEDSSFYANPGIDPRRVIGAFLENAEAGEVVSGASTITMQLARMLFFSTQERFEQSMERKVFEALLAQELTSLYSKDEILEMYLNMTHFGRRVYGIEAASQEFFGKSAADLSLAEATLLAGMPQQPGEFDLLADIAPVKDRQRTVLSLMVRHGYLTQAEADEVYAEEVHLNHDSLSPITIAPHFVQYVTDEMNQRLEGQDISRAGLRVYTTLDAKLQSLAEKVVTEQVEILKPQFDLSNAALVALKPGTGEILAMVGSANFDDPAIDGQVNVATSLRQPGSAIKPVLYATAIEDSLVSPATVIWDVPAEYKLSDTEKYEPVNYDDEFHGPVTVRTALANSYNVPAIKLLDGVGVARMLEKARDMGIESLTRDQQWYGLSLTLGGGEVTLLDLVDAFHTLANGGVHVEPHALQEILDIGNMSSTQVFPDGGNRVLEESSAYLVTDILSDNEARKPEFGENSALKLSRPAAAKTGTTTDFRDNWTVGYTRYLVAGVWAGNSDGRPMVHASGVTGAAPIWNGFMEAVLAAPDLMESLGMPQEDELWDFPIPDTVVQRTIHCPVGITCPQEERFSMSWLGLLGDREPNSDSVVGDKMRPVYAYLGQRTRAMGACSDGQGESRMLLRMPFGIGASLPWYREVNSERITFDEDYAKRVSFERNEAMLWSTQHRQPMYIGLCNQVDDDVRKIFGDSALAVSVGWYSAQIAQNTAARQQVATPTAAARVSQRSAGQTSPATAEVQATPTPSPTAVPSGPEVVISTPGNTYQASGPSAISAGSSRYNLVGVAHDGGCGGNFVMGTVTNANNQAVAGVRVLYSDQFGNRLETTTSGQMPGYGSFRFAIGGDAPQTINVTLLGSNGVPTSPTANVPHMQGNQTDLGCHYTIWKGVD